MHQVGGTDPHLRAGRRAFADLRAVGVSERVDAAVLQETAEDGTHADVLGKPRNARLQRADAAFDDIDLHTGLAGAVQRVNGLLVNDGVDLDLDPRLLAGARGVLLAADALDQAGTHGARRHQQAVEARLRRVAGQLVEQAGHILTDHRIAGQQAQIGVDAGGLRIVVAGAHVAVAAQSIGLLAHHKAQLAVGLQSHDAVHHVHARAFELAGPRDVGVLVEARLDLDQSQHLLARVRGVNQRVDNRRIAGRTVQRLLDGQHLRVGGGLRQERLHGRREGIVRVVQQDVAFADGGEDVLRTGRFDLRDLAVGGRNERAVLEVRTVDASKLEQHGRVERRRQTVDLVGADAQLVGEQLGQERAGLVGDLQTDRRSEAAAQQLLLHGVEQVLGVILLHVDVLVTGDAEGAGLLDDHAGEQGFQMGDDQVLHGDEAVAHVAALVLGQVIDGHEAVQVSRNLHAGEVRLAGGWVLHQHGEVERAAGDVRERMCRIHGERRQDGEHLLSVVAREPLLLGRGELVPAQQHDLLLG